MTDEWCAGCVCNEGPLCAAVTSMPAASGRMQSSQPQMPPRLDLVGGGVRHGGGAPPLITVKRRGIEEII